MGVVAFRVVTHPLIVLRPSRRETVEGARHASTLLGTYHGRYS